jgi:cytochrome bd-type quinol oxidase subunit 2
MMRQAGHADTHDVLVCHMLDVSINDRMRSPSNQTPSIMNRIALLTLATFTGLVAAYSLWQNLEIGEQSMFSLLLRVAITVAVIGTTLVTWEALFKAKAAREQRLRRAALLILVIGVLGIGVNAFISSRTNDPDGPIFVLSLILILQGFLTVAYASRSE